MNPCKDCVVDMICTKECPLFKIDLDRLQTDELIYINRCVNNISNYKSYKILKDVEVEVSFTFIRWLKNGNCHRDNNNPAIIYSGGTKYWYRNGKLHRDNDQPTIIDSNGTRHWYKNGKRHRDNDQPAIIYYDGTKEWFKNDNLHRDNDQPAVIHPSGEQCWFKNGLEYEPM